MNISSKILISTCTLLLVSPISIRACDPDCVDCYFWNGEYCEPRSGVECNSWTDCPNGGWCCDCPEPDCECVMSDFWCGYPWYSYCHVCDACGCVCDVVTSVSGVSGPYRLGDTATVTAQMTYSRPQSCPISWSSNPPGAVSFWPNPSLSTSTTATFLQAGWITVSAQSCCQVGWTSSSSFAVVKVDKVVGSGTMDEGPLHPGCPNTSAGLEAIPMPSGAAWPPGEPHWAVESQPSGAIALLSSSSGSATTTAYGMHRWGNYVIRAKCGSSDAGDSITVSFNLVNETPYSMYCPTWGSAPTACSGVLPCDGEDSHETDDCGGELEFSCSRADGTGGAPCAYHVFWNNSLLSSCVFTFEPENEVYRMVATVEGTNLKVITGVKHINESGKKTSGSCDGYYCTKFYKYNTMTGATDTIWRRCTDHQPLNENDGDECPGH